MNISVPAQSLQHSIFKRVIRMTWLLSVYFFLFNLIRFGNWPKS